MTKLKESCSDIINCESKTIEDKVSDNCLSVKNVMIACFKGGTPKYVEKSKTLVLNQKCIRNNAIDFSFAQYIPDDSIKNPEKEIKVGDLLINSTGEGTAGRCAFVSSLPDNIRVTVDSHMLIVRFSNLELSRIFSYFFYNNEKLMLSLLTGSSGQGEFDKERAFNIKFPYNKKNQRVFCYIFDRIAHKIELNNKINRELEKTAKDLYNYWFVQFDFPDGNKRPYKSSGGKMVYNDVLKREIPEGWEGKSLGDICNLYQPETISEKDCMPNGKYYVYGSNGIIGKYDRKNHDESEIVVSCRGDCGNVIRTMPNVWITGNAMVVHPKSGVDQEFIYFALQNAGIKRIITGSVQGQITRKNLEPVKVIIPPTTLLEQYEKLICNNVTIRIQNNIETELLQNLRDFLLPMLMNGQVSVSD